MALLEEEKGNLQLSLVDFDELKGRNQEKFYRRRFRCPSYIVGLSMQSVLIFFVDCFFYKSNSLFFFHNPVSFTTTNIRPNRCNYNVFSVIFVILQIDDYQLYKHRVCITGCR